MAETAIEWATHVWNPTTGCDRTSPGCAHCYALAYAARLKAMGQPKYQADGGKASGPGFALTMHEDELDAPLSWRAPRRVFVNSMSDLFHERVDWRFVARCFAVMSIAEQHTFMVLTKRPHLMRALLTTPMFWLELNAERMRRCVSVLPGGMSDTWPTGERTLANIWLGVSIENRRYVGRADELRETPAAVRFISAEPLLGELINTTIKCTTCRTGPLAIGVPGSIDPPPPYSGTGGAGCPDCELGTRDASLDLAGIDWLIVGGESGPGARPMRLEWARDLRDACQTSGTAFFVKQLGGHRPGTALADLPADLRIRQYPNERVA